MMTTTILRISGMTCDGCRESVETALQNVEGVQAARVDLESGKAQVLHGRGVDGDRLAGAAREAGFEARVEQE